MHMSDVLISPAVGGAFWLVSGSLIGYSSGKISKDGEDAGVKTPLMGVMGAFIFAAQMINFSIPGTGSSGHIGGGLLLAALLGPYRAFIALASVLVVQCVLFADGGLLALGCNIFNLAFFPAFIAYPYIFRKIAGETPNSVRLAAASVLASVSGLLMGAFSVVIETSLSGITDLPFNTFVLFMLPIHLLIGIVEGFATWGVLEFVAKTQPVLLYDSADKKSSRALFAGLGVAILLVGGFMSWFASSQPDGLEWSISKVTGSEELSATVSHRIHKAVAVIQERLSFLPDYSFAERGGAPSFEKEGESSVINLGTTVSGLAGSLFVFLAAGALGMLFRNRNYSISNSKT